MVSTTRRRSDGISSAAADEVTGGGIPPSTDSIPVSGGYEDLREKRIRENKERLEKLGILDLSQKLKPSKKNPRHVPTDAKALKAHSGSERRSSRLKTLTPVSYTEIVVKKKKGSPKEVKINLQEGSQPEIYTEEHEKLLGSCEAEWILSVDGCGEDGRRVLDSVNGQTCHQCRQKALGLHTSCWECELVQGQFCGDCLFMRYGENVIEVNQNPDWICPVCRGICNCSLCRKEKGWLPTGNLYRKITKLGFKSVAHYLIQTYRAKSHPEDLPAEDPAPEAEQEMQSSHSSELQDASEHQ